MQRKLNFATGEFERVQKCFEDCTVGELKEIIEGSDVQNEATVDAKSGLAEGSGIERCSPLAEEWFDREPTVNMFEDEDDAPGQAAPLLGLSWRS